MPDWRWALSRYFFQGKLQIELLKFFLDLDEEKTILAIRASGTVGNLQHGLWVTLRQLLDQSDKPYLKLQTLINLVEYLSHKYQALKNSYLALQKSWQWSQLDVLIFSGLYVYEVLLKQCQSPKLSIPYQTEASVMMTPHEVLSALHDLVVQACHIPANKLAEAEMAMVLKNVFKTFLADGETNTLLWKSYEAFKECVAYKVGQDFFEQTIFARFSYDEGMIYKVSKGRLHYQASGDTQKQDVEKAAIFYLYWQWRGLSELEAVQANSLKQLLLGDGDELTRKLHATITAKTVMMLLKEVYGIEQVTINNVKYDLFTALLTFCTYQQFYGWNFVKNFLEKSAKEKTTPSLELFFELFMQALLEGKNRLPLSFNKKKDKLYTLLELILNNGKKVTVKKLEPIIDFWSVDLETNQKEPYAEKLFYRLGDWIFDLPIAFDSANVYSSIVNYFRRLHKNRSGLRGETDRIEKNLAELFSKHGWKVFSQHKPKESTVGEMDLVITDQQTVLLIELKSSFIKTNLKESHQYREGVLKTASVQLDKKLNYIQNNMAEFVSSPSAKGVQCHAWIVDTTLEADHELINGYLKVSFEELMILLKGHQDFMNFYADTTQKMSKIANLQGFVNKVKGNALWKKTLPLYQKLHGVE